MDGCWNKWRGPRGAHKTGARLGGVGRSLRPCGSLVHPPGVFLVLEILKYSIKNHTKFSGHLENFYFGVFLYCTDKSENRQKNTIFYFISTK